MHYIYLGGIYKEEHAFGKESFWLFCKWFWKAFENHCEQRNMRCISHITNHCFPSSQLAWARVKINLGGGCASTGLNTCNDTKSHWVAFTSKKMRLEQNLLDCTQWELKTQFEKNSRTNTQPIYFFLRQQSFPFFPGPRVKLIWGWVYWFGTPWVESDETALISCIQCLLRLPLLPDVLNHAYGLGWPYWRPYVPETLDTFTPTSNNFANHTPIN